MTVHDAEAQGWRRAALRAIGRSLLTFAVVLVVYYLIPFNAGVRIEALLQLALGLIALAVIVVWQVRQIGKARYPALRAMEAVGVALPLFLCAFAATYVILSGIDPASFSEKLSHSNALYFTTVVFGTVGFGDIVPLTDLTRLLVAAQILADLVFLSLVVRTLFEASRRAVSTRKAGRPAD